MSSGKATLATELGKWTSTSVNKGYWQKNHWDGNTHKSDRKWSSWRWMDGWRKWTTFSFTFSVKLDLFLMPFSDSRMQGRASSYSRNFFFFPYRGMKPSLLSTLAREIRCLQAFKRSPIMTESLMERWLSGSVKWTFPFSALQLLAVDSIHLRKWIACGAFPKSWVSSFVVGSHSYFLIEAFFPFFLS